MSPRAPQPLADIGERVELLKSTLGMFPPGEPVPIARELYQLGEEVLLHWLLARGHALAEDLSLLGLADEVAQLDCGLEAASDMCREISRLEESVVHDADAPETGSRLAALSALVGDLYALVAPKVAAAKS
ncbi:MAG TPA: hypothetical protein VMH36_05845 [Alphaproteobacteria bacterium]|nr:hypothetical protein [Alphaproteobacteria bacterium]